MELKTQLTEALSMLTEKEKTVVLLYYYEDLTLKEISRVMEVSESRHFTVTFQGADEDAPMYER